MTICIEISNKITRCVKQLTLSSLTIIYICAFTKVESCFRYIEAGFGSIFKRQSNLYVMVRQLSLDINFTTSFAGAILL